MEDLEVVDPVYAKSLKWILENDITGIIDETFQRISQESYGERGVRGADHKRGTKGRGRNMDVTNENKQEYVEGMIDFSMSGKFKHQLDAFLKGFYEIVPRTRGFLL